MQIRRTAGFAACCRARLRGWTWLQVVQRVDGSPCAPCGRPRARLGSEAEMAKPPRPWIVTKHGPIEKLEDNLWVVAGDVPGIPFRRRMSIIKRADGTLL